MDDYKKFFLIGGGVLSALLLFLFFYPESAPSNNPLPRMVEVQPNIHNPRTTSNFLKDSSLKKNNSQIDKKREILTEKKKIKENQKRESTFREDPKAKVFQNSKWYNPDNQVILFPSPGVILHSPEIVIYGKKEDFFNKNFPVHHYVLVPPVASSRKELFEIMEKQKDTPPLLVSLYRGDSKTQAAVFETMDKILNGWEMEYEVSLRLLKSFLFSRGESDYFIRQLERAGIPKPVVLHLKVKTYEESKIKPLLLVENKNAPPTPGDIFEKNPEKAFEEIEQYFFQDKTNNQFSIALLTLDSKYPQRWNEIRSRILNRLPEKYWGKQVHLSLLFYLYKHKLPLTQQELQLSISKEKVDPKNTVIRINKDKTGDVILQEVGEFSRHSDWAARELVLRFPWRVSELRFIMNRAPPKEWGSPTHVTILRLLMRYNEPVTPKERELVKTKHHLGLPTEKETQGALKWKEEAYQKWLNKNK